MLTVNVCVVSYVSRLSQLQPWICKESAEFAKLEEVFISKVSFAIPYVEW